MKHLFIIGLEEKLQNHVISRSPVPATERIVLTCYGPFISGPYDSLLRSVILSVYQEEVKEITIVGAAGSSHSTLTGGEIIDLMKQAKVQEENFRTVDYLFKYCNSGFTANNLEEWLQGDESVAQGIQKTAELIRKHPLLPQGIKVSGLLVDTENGEEYELQPITA